MLDVVVYSHLGVPPAEWWPGVCSVDASLFGEEAWTVSKPMMERLLAARGYALAVAIHGDALVGFSSAVAITDQCARELTVAPLEGRDLLPGDVLTPVLPPI